MKNSKAVIYLIVTLGMMGILLVLGILLTFLIYSDILAVENKDIVLVAIVTTCGGALGGLGMAIAKNLPNLLQK